jgi:hypothetical protein
MFWDAFKAGDFDYLLQWMKNNWTLSLYISLVYVILIFWGQVCFLLFYLCVRDNVWLKFATGIMKCDH